MADSTSPKLNPQVVEAVNTTNTAVVGVARGQSQALAYESLANALQLMMLNVSQNQFGSQKIEIAAVSATVAKIIAAG